MSARFATLCAWAASAGLSALVLSHVRAQAPAPLDGLTVPEGFVVERVAGPPLVERPIVADFDEQGRLYVADSSGSNEKVEKQLADRPHRIVRLEDKNRDGVFDTSVVFADRMMLPEGTLWYEGSLYVAAPPSIWKLTDTNDDGVADLREEWFQGKTLTGCANDLHGPYLGLDGWIYWTKGAFAEQTYERPGQSPLVTKAAHVLRRFPGRSIVEPVLTGGMDNPVDVAFTPAGERILTSTFIEHPQVGRRDGLIHAIYGGVYGKRHAVIDGHPRTGELMPELLGLGAAVPAGLTRYASRAFGEGYRDNFFAALFNLHKVTRVTLEPQGATFVATPSDFLVSNSRDFHPTDVIEDADGSLLVIDTGPWYKLCCPTSQLAKPDLPGAVYRIRRQGVAVPRDPRGLALDWANIGPPELAKLLDDDRPAVVERTLRRFAALGEGAVSALESVVGTAAAVNARRNAVWALTRIDHPRARAAVRPAFNDADVSVRTAAAHSAGVWRDRAAVDGLLKALASGVPGLQRAAAEALGRVGDRRAVGPLLERASAKSDRILEHSLIYALIEIGDPEQTAAGLRLASPEGRRAALVALNEMSNGGLAADTVVSLLESAEPEVRATAWWIAGRHPEWGESLSGFFAKRLGVVGGSSADHNTLRDELARFADTPSIQTLLAATVLRPPTPDARAIALGAMTGARELSERWVPAVAAAIDSGDRTIVERALAVARMAPPAKVDVSSLRAALLRYASTSTHPMDLRVDALAAVPAPLEPVSADQFGLLLDGLAASQPLNVRVSAATAIEKARLDRQQLLALSRALESVGPLELPKVLRAFEATTDEAVGLAMIDALGRAAARSSLRADTLTPRVAKYPPSVHKASDELLTRINEGAAVDARRLSSLLDSVKGGDRRRGQAVFNGAKAACSACHAIGYLGGRIGPDLTNIGRVRSERDLLESIVYPSVSFARGYEPVVVTMRSGESRSGILRADARDHIVLAAGEREESRIARQEIKDMSPGVVSLMPPGLADVLTREELADLLAFLVSNGQPQ